MPIVKRRRHPTAVEPEMCYSVEAVIKKLGGDEEVRTLTGRTQNFISNWRADGIFPSNTYKKMNDALAAKGATAPSSLWRMLE